MSKPLPGRQGQAARNNQVILDAARDVFLADPKAPIAAVAERAGVGISALYRRYPGKEDLLRTLCHDGLRRFIAEAERAAGEPEPAASLTGHLAGMFTPTPEMRQDAELANRLVAGLVERAGDRLRPGVVVEDLGLL